MERRGGRGFPLQPQSMQAVLTQASKAKTKTAKEKILKDNGMHDIEVSLPELTILPFVNYPMI